jgi:hypothetical protein
MLIIIYNCIIFKFLPADRWGFDLSIVIILNVGVDEEPIYREKVYKDLSNFGSVKFIQEVKNQACDNSKKHIHKI